MKARRVSMLLVVLAVLAACEPEPSSPQAAPSPKPARSHGGYYLQMPLEADSPRVDTTGGAVINVESNLPDGTLAYITSHIPGRGWEEIFLLHRFAGGTLKLRQNRYCVSERAIDFSRGFDIQVVVVPDISLIFKGEKAACRSLTSCGTGPLQPRSVQAILGRNFERLTGDAVTTIIGTPALVASAHYAWPKDACTEPLDLAGGSPRVCPPSTASINEDEGGANIEAVVESIAILIRKNRICDLYNATTDEFQRANTWSGFRDRLLRWAKRKTAYAMHRGAFFTGPGTVGVLESPRFIEAYYLIWGREAAHARLVASRSSSGHTKWKMAEFDLS